ncbi:MAG: Peptidase M16 domain protein [Candidatus Collierbacteria bacterium GW2011_GWE2_42_48]|nr:MAG: Peptidase M16 domain protein [Candidatus Collierbacteria bacterium GW2011_GWE2_42_48]
MDTNFRQININGALVALYKTNSLKTISLDVRIKAGSWYEDSEKWSDSKAMEIYKEENGIWSNASTSGQRIELIMKMPSESIIAGLRLMEEMLFKTKISEDKLAKEKKVVLQEYEDKWSRSGVRFSKKVDQQYFGKNHLYTRDGLGDKEYLNTVSMADLIEYQKEMFVPANMVIGIAGNIDFESIEKELRKMLILSGNVIEKKFNKVQPQTERLIHYESGMSTVIIDVGWTIGGIAETTFEDRLKMGIAAYILGGSPRSLLHSKVREELALAYSISMVFGYYQVAGWISVKSSVKPENLEEVLKEIDSVIETFVDHPIKADLFNRAKKYLGMSEQMKFESTMNIAGNLCGYLFWEGRVVLPEEYEAILEKITEDQVRMVLKEAIDGKKPLISIMKSE